MTEILNTREKVERCLIIKIEGRKEGRKGQRFTTKRSDQNF